MAIARIVTRREWRAASPKAIVRQDPADVRYLVVHYSAMSSDQRDRHAECAERVRAIQHYHMTSDQLTPGGASDIGYSWLVCRHGYVFRGRGWRRLPAATGGANAFTVAACFLGGDKVGRRDVTDAAREAYRELVRFCDRNGPSFAGVRGHRDFGPTSCPGDELYRFVKLLDAEVREGRL